MCFLHSGLQWTYQPGSHRKKVKHRIFHQPSFCGACLNFSREKDSAIPFSLVDREVEFCVLCNDSIVLHPLGIFLVSFFSFSVRKIPFAGIELMSQRVRGYMVPLSSAFRFFLKTSPRKIPQDDYILLRYKTFRTYVCTR